MVSKNVSVALMICSPSNQVIYLIASIVFYQNLLSLNLQSSVHYRLKQTNMSLFSYELSLYIILRLFINFKKIQLSIMVYTQIKNLLRQKSKTLPVLFGIQRFVTTFV